MATMDDGIGPVGPLCGTHGFVNDRAWHHDYTLNRKVWTPRADFTFADHGSIIIVTPQSEAAKAWLDETAPEDAQRWGADGLVVEPRYITMFCDAANDAGFSL